jgi:exopolysaccharide biosynthesis protein
MVQPDTVRSVRIGEGVLYRYLWSSKGPWAVHIVESALDRRCDLVLDVVRAEAREKGGRGHEPVTAMVARAGPSVLAAVNADFFTPEGATVGVEVVDGTVTTARSRPALAWRPGEAPWMGVTSVEGGSMQLGWPVSIEGGDGVTEAVGGYPELLHEGDWVGDLGVDANAGFAASRHPRTAVGYAPGPGLFWLVVVDGRQPPHSSGMTLPELASLLQALGATEALNLDGGGSSVMVLRGHPVNSPSDPEGERPVVNGLAIRRSVEGCGPSAP